MPLPLPSLDRLDFTELVAEGRAALPALAPGWTDYNAHDPGITLLELFAWLAESNSYRLDQIPDAARRAFLRLVGVEQKPARSAETALVFSPSGAPVSLPAASRVSAGSGASAISFQSVRSLFVSTASLRAIISGSNGTFTDLTVRNTHTSLNFLPLGLHPARGDALYLGFDQALAPQDTEISLWVFGADPSVDREIRSRIDSEAEAERAEADCPCPGQAHGQGHDQEHVPLHYSARTVWEFYAGNHQWQPLSNVEDETRALTLSGPVRFKAPDPARHAAGGAAAVAIAAYATKHFIRCRLAGGGYDCPPQIAALALNAVLARHAVDAPASTFRSTGCAGQVFVLADQAVVPDSTQARVVLRDGTQDVGWQEAPSWDGVGPHDRVYVLDAERATVSFGDGRFGRVPSADAKVTVNFQLGGGTAGNLAANSLDHLVPANADLTVGQPFAASGGAASEMLAAANARAVAELATPTRATTLTDCAFLARAIPGAAVARAQAIANYHPDLPCIPVSGSITVAILPPCPDSRPEPSPDLVAHVQRHLERRRLVAGEIHVVAPPYTIVAVLAVLHPGPGVDARELARRAERALQAFFHPLRGGPDGDGWTFGRSVYRAEVLALLNGVEGVLYVDQLAWRVDDGSPRLCGNVTICRHGLVASGNHEILVDEGSGCNVEDTHGKTPGAPELLQRHGCGCSGVQD